MIFFLLGLLSLDLYWKCIKLIETTLPNRNKCPLELSFFKFNSNQQYFHLRAVVCFIPFFFVPAFVERSGSKHFLPIIFVFDWLIYLLNIAEECADKNAYPSTLWVLIRFKLNIHRILLHAINKTPQTTCCCCCH